MRTVVRHTRRPVSLLLQNASVSLLTAHVCVEVSLTVHVCAVAHKGVRARYLLACACVSVRAVIAVAAEVVVWLTLCLFRRVKAGRVSDEWSFLCHKDSQCHELFPVDCSYCYRFQAHSLLEVKRK